MKILLRIIGVILLLSSFSIVATQWAWLIGLLPQPKDDVVWYRILYVCSAGIGGLFFMGMGTEIK